MNALFISWFALTSIFIQDITAPQPNTIGSFHVSPRSFSVEPTLPTFEDSGQAILQKYKTDNAEWVSNRN